MSNCIICYKASKEVPEVPWNGRETLKGFFSLLERHLDPENSSGDETDKQAPLDNLINAGMNSCETCSKVVNSFCELYHRMKSVELELNSKLRSLKYIMATAERAPARKKEFIKSAKQLKAGDEASVEKSVDQIFRYKLDLVKKCMWKLETDTETLTLVKCPDPIYEDSNNTDVRHPSPMESPEADNEDTAPDLSIVKYEPIELMSTADSDSEMDQPLSNGSSNSWNVPSPGVAESDAPSPEDNSSEDGELADQIRNEILPPVIITAGRSTEDIVTPQSTVDPSTGKYKCCLCTKEFKHENHFKRHHKNVHLSLRYQCPLCNKEFTREDDYKKHHLSVHTGKYECTKCNKRFHTKIELTNHQVFHRISTSSKTLRGSTSISSKTGKHKCQVCHKTFSCRKDGLRHYRSIHAGEKFQCPRCSKYFSRKDKLLRHQRDVCGMPEVDPGSEKTQKLRTKPIEPKPTCDQCGETFTRIRQVKRHMKTVHQHIRDHVCDTCGMKFSMPRDLRRHVDAVHLQIREFSCDMCEKAFSRNSQLKLHVNAVHLKLKEHVCDQCGKGFIDSSELKRHVKVVHLQLLDHVCELCGKGFSLGAGLRNHMKTVHLQLLEHECNECGRKFNLKCQLGSHRRKMHSKQLHQEPSNGSDISALKSEPSELDTELDQQDV